MSDRNTGDRNTGNWNTGDRNTGNWNTGDWNTGNRNTGNRNTGDRNTGNWNTGNRNTGDRNTGNWNTGNWNTGNWNTGNWNTGHWNTGHWNTGYFCENDGPVMFFDQACSLTRGEAVDAIPWVDLPVGVIWIARGEMTADEVAANPNCDTLGGYLKACVLPINEAMPQVWPTLDIETRRKFLALPNFDADKFQRITGVDVRADAELFPRNAPAAVSPVAVPAKTITIDGVEYQLVPVAK